MCNLFAYSICSTLPLYFLTVEVVPFAFPLLFISAPSSLSLSRSLPSSILLHFFVFYHVWLFVSLFRLPSNVFSYLSWPDCSWNIHKASKHTWSLRRSEILPPCLLSRLQLEVASPLVQRETQCFPLDDIIVVNIERCYF